MKGQSPVFEQVMLFVLGVAIFVICFSMFRIYENYFTDATVRDQLDAAKDYISSNILKLSKRGGEINSSIMLKIPTRASNQPYRITLSDRGINVTSLSSKMYSDSYLYNLSDSFELGGGTISSYGKCIIYKNGNRIIIE